MTLIKVEIPKKCFHKEEDVPPCKGLVFRGHVHSYISSHRSIEVRKSLRLLKRKSCPGCEKCEWVWDEMMIEIYDGEIEDFIEEIKNGKMYKLKTEWCPGPHEYPADGETEYSFEEFKEVKNEK